MKPLYHLVLDETDDWTYSVPAIVDRVAGRARATLQLKTLDTEAIAAHRVKQGEDEFFVLGDKLAVSAPGWGEVGIFVFMDHQEAAEFPFQFQSQEHWT